MQTIIVALDYSDREQALAFADSVDPKYCRLKVGKEMFTLFGPQIVRDLKKRGFDIFLDLKFHDIPKTVERAVAAAAELDLWMINVHASGGESMMKAARKALLPLGKQSPMLVAVTLLTSMESNDLARLGIRISPFEYVKRLAKLTQQCGLDGVVCSACEAAGLKKIFGNKLSLVTPGIRPPTILKQDHQRVMTPKEAIESGADYLVIGRPITQSPNPAQILFDLIKK